MIKRLREAFEARFGDSPRLFVQAPGRVNLIGEHTDYNRGYVFPIAIDRVIMFAARPRADSLVRLYSLDYQQMDSFRLDSFERLSPGDGAPTWSNYPRGVIRELRDAGHPLQGFDAVLGGDIPQGAGLSSSAAIEVGTGTLLNALFDLGLSRKELALLAQRAENDFVGVKCGIMDQFISALGQPDHALFIDCRSLDYRTVPLRLASSEAAILIVNSGIRRGLVDSEFNARRSQCEEAVALLSKLSQRQIESLREVDRELWQEVSKELPPVLRARATHVLSENERVLRGVAALEGGDLNTFGQLMNQSHQSLRDNYQVSTPHLDRLVELSQKQHGVYGSRLTGAGFGGCTVSLVETCAIEPFRQRVLATYREETGNTPSMLVCQAAAGAHVLS